MALVWKDRVVIRDFQGSSANMLTRFCYSHTSGHVFQRTETIFEFSRSIITTNVRTKELKSRYALLVAIFFNEPEPFSKKADTSLRHTFEHDKDIIGTTFLTEFHDNQAIHVTFRVLTRKIVDDALRTNGDP
ncbi:hypothetical protein DPMN_068920 [Dreissena polymorpha]|uniref:Uncharacterized protein n=1 Tax=Dreissena polymorpha TaxID=45954 RepID=A0A9D4BUL8_DREPO|nr:hypothetical protein DPMN_068920 [Dreissena polymorpha]